MNIFLVLSSSAAAFYVFILFALWRDSRKRHNGHVVSCSSTDFDEVRGYEIDGADTTPHWRQSKFSDGVLLVPLTKLHLPARRSTDKPVPAAPKAASH